MGRPANGMIRYALISGETVHPSGHRHILINFLPFAAMSLHLLCYAYLPSQGTAMCIPDVRIELNCVLRMIETGFAGCGGSLPIGSQAKLAPTSACGSDTRIAC